MITGTAAIISKCWTYREKSYYLEALNFYSEVVFIDPSLVSYRRESGQGMMRVCCFGRELDTLSMLYPLDQSLETRFLVSVLGASGCPTAQPTLVYDNDVDSSIASALGRLDVSAAPQRCLLFSLESARDYLISLHSDQFPLVGLSVGTKAAVSRTLLTSCEEAFEFCVARFAEDSAAICLERKYEYCREFRVFVIDGEPVAACQWGYDSEDTFEDGKQIRRLLPLAAAECDALFDVSVEYVPQQCRTGVFRLDIGEIHGGLLHLRNFIAMPNFRQLQRRCQINLPYLAHRLISERAAVDTTVVSPTESWSLSLLGDTNPGDSYQEQREERGQSNMLKRRGHYAAFAAFQGFLDESDFTIANLEVAVTQRRVTRYAGLKPYIDWSEPKQILPVLRRLGIDAVSLANNHTMDFEAEGLLEACGHLRNLGIDLLGAGRSAYDAGQPLIHTIKCGNVEQQIGLIAGFEHRSTHVELGYYADRDSAGVNCWSQRSISLQIGALREKNPGIFIIASPHWGKNYALVNDRQRRMARAMVKAGVDLIVGHGSHSLQEIEQIDGKWVVYSLGNFVFGSPGRFRKENALPFGLLGRLCFRRVGQSLDAELRLYPINTDNKKNDYLPNFVDPAQFERVVNFYLPHQGNSGNLKTQLVAGADHHGFYLSLNVRGRALGIADVG